ncbi:MAG: HXXEE domain-containing protein [Firmicutes bacterium]|nr:HXXEE domain-containing protein [Bacillota bacterium]
MISFLKKYNIELLSVIMFAVTVLTVFLPEPSITRKFLTVYIMLYVLHVWEENRYPGGFTKIMEKIIGKTFTEDAKAMSHIPVFILLLAILLIPYALDSVAVLFLIPVFLGIFEGFVHTMGVKASKAEKFYTPGMVTAYCLLAFSAFVIYYLASHGMASGKEFALGFVCMFASFACMQNRVLAINGVKYKDMLQAMKSRLRG